MLKTHEEMIGPISKRVVDYVICDMCLEKMENAKDFNNSIRFILHALDDTIYETSFKYEKIETDENGTITSTSQFLHLCPECMREVMKCIEDTYGAEHATKILTIQTKKL